MSHDSPAAHSPHLRALAPWLIGLWLPWAWLTGRFWFICDDAYITMRFARNLARGRGLVFNVGEAPPVEGYSDFLWLLVAAAVERLQGPVEVVLPVLSAACGAGLLAHVMVVATHRLRLPVSVAFAATLPLAASPAFAVWSTSGLETMPFAWAVFALFDAWVLDRGRRAHVAAAVGVALVLVRTEGWAWVAVIGALALWVPWWSGRRSAWRPLLASMALVAAVFVAYNAWRLSYYGTLVPNTALVKVGLGPEIFGRGLKYVALFLLTTVTPALGLLGLPLAWRALRAEGVAIGAMALGFLAYGVVVGGDFMPFGRLVLPALPFLALLGAFVIYAARLRGGAAVMAGVAVAAVGVLSGFDVHMAPEPLRAALHFRLSDKHYLSEWAKWDNMVDNTDGFLRRGRALAKLADPGDAVVSGAVGALGYASDLWIWDQYGLVTKEVAYRPFAAGRLRESPGHDKKVPAEYFAKYQPTYLYARTVKGRAAANQMKDSLMRWEVDPLVMDRYVPDFVEVDVGADARTFLLSVRRVRGDEDPAVLWREFEGRRAALHAALKDEAASEEEDG